MKPIRIAVLVAIGAAVVALAGVGRPDLAGGASEASGGITVNGTGTVQTVPDQAQFSLGVETKGPTAREALAANSERMRRVLAALDAAGIAKGDVQTQDVSVSRSYPNDGYSADNSVLVTIRDLARAGSILDAASNAGADNVYGPTLSRSNQDELNELQAKALREAVDNARAKARALAEAAGVHLGSVTAIMESGAEPMPYYDVALAKRTPTAEAPIEPGKQEIQATVRVTFAIG
jgi:uncharacterized protein